MTEIEKMDAEWRKYGEAWGWKLPQKAHWFFRLWLIRYVRCAWLQMKVERHYNSGIGCVGVRTGYDNWVLYAVARGWV